MIVLDIMLPRRNGYDVCRELRADGIWTPILMLTAKDGEYDEADAFDLGADDYLTKPFSFVVLVARLRVPDQTRRTRAADRPERRRPHPRSRQPRGTPRRRDRRADPARVRRCCSSSCVTAARCVSKTEILDNVWDLHYDGADNVVEVYVGYLRRKIDLPFGRASIETVRGAGYRLAGNGG